MPEAGAGVVLVGMPGSGKSSVARALAARLERELIDTDALLERRLGSSVPAYLERHGEAAFRRVEAQAVADACAHPGAVIAAGGGAVLDPLNRWALWQHGTVAWLDAPPSLLAERLAADPVPRPTFQPYDPQRLADVLVERAPAYRAADLRLDAAEAPEALADVLASTSVRPGGRRLLDAELRRHHPIGPDTARVVMGVDLDVTSIGEPGVAVVDRRLLRAAPRLVASIPARACLPVVAGEHAKRLRTLERVLEWLAEQRTERDMPLIAVGGGTVGDLAGTAAALFARGLPLVQVPTTWLAQADSAIGGKVAVDLLSAKNAVGAFWPPTATYSDISALRSLSLVHRRDGMAESIKSALIGDATLWELIESRGARALTDDEPARYAIVERSARLKLAVCERDPFEEGERRTLNLGHTIGHALEVESRYGLSHGAAVALGLRAVAAIAARRGGDSTLAARLDSLLARLGFALTRSFDATAVRTAMLGDKKRRAGRQRWILPMEIGRTNEVDDVTDAELDRALAVIGT